FNQVVANAARAGAETGAIHRFTPFTQTFWENRIHDTVLAEMQHLPFFDASKFTYSLATSVDADQVKRVDVSVSYPFETIVSWPGLPTNINLHRTFEFRQFR